MKALQFTPTIPVFRRHNILITQMRLQSLVEARSLASLLKHLVNLEIGMSEAHVFPPVVMTLLVLLMKAVVYRDLSFSSNSDEHFEMRNGVTGYQDGLEDSGKHPLTDCSGLPQRWRDWV